MTKALAMEWGPHGVRVKLYRPGVHSHRFDKELLVAAAHAGVGRGEHPAGTPGPGRKDMIGAAIFLASEASAFMTGRSYTWTAASLAGCRGRLILGETVFNQTWRFAPCFQWPGAVTPANRSRKRFEVRASCGESVEVGESPLVGHGLERSNEVVWTAPNRVSRK